MSDWILITGAARGLGAHLAEALSKKGYFLVLHYHKSEKEIKELAKKCKQAEIISGDFSSKEGVDRFLKEYLNKYSPTKALINNVGNYLIKSGLETSEEEWIDLFQTNLHAPFMITKALLPSLKKAKGRVINIGIAGVNQIRARTHSTAYSITKTALWELTLSLAKELEEVSVNMVSPGYMPNSIELPKNKKVVSFEEVAQAVFFLLDNPAITGQNIEVARGVGL